MARAVRLALLAAGAAAAPAPAPTPFAPANVFASGMVLQRDGPVTVWGWGASGAVTLTFNGGRIACPATNGTWRCTLPATPAGGPYDLELATSTGQAASLREVLFGDVYLASGQSNMQVGCARRPARACHRAVKRGAPQWLVPGLPRAAARF